MSRLKAHVVPVLDMHLVVQEDGKVGLVWAGCYYGPADDLAKVFDPKAAEFEQLTQLHREITKNPGAFKEHIREAVDPDDGLGVRWI